VLWTVVTATVTVFHIASTKGAAVLRTLIGAYYALVVSCDRAKAYRWVGRIQWCWAHLRRDFQAMINRGGEAGKVGADLLCLADTMFGYWQRVRDGTLSRRTFQNYLVHIRSLFCEQLERGLECGCAATAATCADLLDGFKNLWHFATVEGVEPTNNAAEQAHRHLVQWRKLCYGSDSPAGSRFVERIASVVATCRRQQRNVLEYLTQCHQAHLHGKPIPLLLPRRHKRPAQAA
jgi:transposase